MSFVTTDTIGLLERVAAFTERRHEVLAGNVANIDTPNYKTRDLDVAGFRRALEAAFQQTREAVTPSLGSLGQPATEPAQLFNREMMRARVAEPGNLTFQDGGNRSIEREMMELTKNQLLQGFAVELIAAQNSLLQSVISERP